MILVSLPAPPGRYPRRRFWHAQMADFVWRGLVARFGAEQVRAVPWGQRVDVGPGDVLVTCLPNVNYAHTRRIVALENDTLRRSRWLSDSAEVYGRTYRIDDVRALRDALEGVPAAVVLTNEVALRRLAEGDPDAMARDAELRRLVGHVAYALHPIDKAGFRAHWPKGAFRPGAPIAIYDDGWRKTSTEILAVAKEAGLREGRDYLAFRFLRKDSGLAMARFRRRHNVVASGSISESGPANLFEFLFQGFHVLGNEEWWPDFGPLSRFSYDPARRGDMRELLRHLADPAATAEIEAERDRILARQLARTDDTWDHYDDLVAVAVRVALER